MMSDGWEEPACERDARLLMSKDVCADVVIGLACRRTLKERLKIAAEYTELTGKNLADDFKRGGVIEYWRVMLALFMNPGEHDAEAIRNALKAKEVDTGTLLEIFVSRTSREIQTAKEYYDDKYRCEFEVHLEQKTSGMFHEVIATLASFSRQQLDVEPNSLVATEDAKLLHKAIRKRSKKERIFVDIFCFRSYSHLRKTFEKFQQLSGHDILIVLEKKFSGELKDILVAIATFTKSPAKYFARRLDDAFKADGKGNDTITRVIVRRREIDLAEIKQEFQEMFGVALEERVEECAKNFSYRKFLLELLK